MKMDFEKVENVLGIVGDKISEGSEFIIKKLSESGLQASSFTIKIIAILILSVLLFFTSKITNTVAKIGIMVSLVLLIVSVVFSII